MFSSRVAPRQLLLRCSSTDILVGMLYRHFPHSCGADERKGVQVQRARRAGMHKCHGCRMHRSDHGCTGVTMDAQE